jgi:hypothetical protein
VLWLGNYEYFLNITLHKNVDRVFMVEVVDTFLIETVLHDVDRVLLPRIEAAILSKIVNGCQSIFHLGIQNTHRVLMLGTVYDIAIYIPIGNDV